MADIIRIKLIHSPIGTKQRVRQTLRGLGLGKVGSTSQLQRTSQVMGMIRRVSHLIDEVKE